MRTILTIAALILIAGGVLVWNATRLPDKFGDFTGAPQADVADVVARPQQYLHKTVLLEGEVRKQCTTMGCYFFFPAGRHYLRVDLADVAMNAPRREGHHARVEGQVVPYNDAYQFWASAVEFK